MEENEKKLEARIVELEQKLASIPVRPEPTPISAEEMKAYRKVKDLLAADYGDFCGVNDCYRVCYTCITASSRCITRCVNECVCGPCACIVQSAGGSGRFGGFGD